MSQFHKYSHSIIEVIITINDKIRAIKDKQHPSGSYIEQYVLYSNKAYLNKTPSKELLDKARFNLSLALLQSYKLLLETYYEDIKQILSKCTSNTISDRFPDFRGLHLKYSNALTFINEQVKLLNIKPVIAAQVLKEIIAKEKYFHECWSFAISDKKELDKFDYRNRAILVSGLTLSIVGNLLLPIGIAAYEDLSKEKTKQDTSKSQYNVITTDRFSSSIILPHDSLRPFDISITSPKIKDLLNAIEELEEDCIIELQQGNKKNFFVKYNYDIIPCSQSKDSIIFKLNIQKQFHHHTDSTCHIYNREQFMQFLSQYKH